MTTKESEELPPSELGTKAYWESAYQVEIENFKNNGDVGEIWFGEDSALRIVRWLSNSNSVSRDDAIVDLGCGNGMMLIELAEEGFKKLTGLDYSSQAIELANTVAREKGHQNIVYKTCDITSCTMDEHDYSIVLDKGTYDAVSLNPENAVFQRQSYKTSLCKMLKQSGLFVISSCNWTEEELGEHFKSDFTIKDVIPAPKFKFGGKVGSSITTIVFQKKS